MYKYNQKHIKFVFSKSTLSRSILTLIKTIFKFKQEPILLQVGKLVGQKFSRGDVTQRRSKITELMVKIHQLFIFVLLGDQVRLRRFLSRTLRWGPSAAASTGLGGRALQSQVRIAAVKPHACRSDVQYNGFGLGQKWSIADLRRSKDTPSHKPIRKQPACGCHSFKK